MARPPKSLMKEYRPEPGTLAWRLATEVDASGRSPAEISVAAGGSRDLIRDIFRRPGQAQMVPTIERLAIELRVNPAWLAFGAGQKTGREERQLIESIFDTLRRFGLDPQAAKTAPLEEAIVKALEQPQAQPQQGGRKLASLSVPEIDPKGLKKPVQQK